MIQHLGKFDKQKNHPDLRAKILALVGKYPRYPHDLYDACRRDTHLSRSGFGDLLDEMQRDGEIRINANTLVLLPKPKRETQPPPAAPPEPIGDVENRPNEILIHCLVNRSIALSHPKQKKYLNNRYYAHQNYTPQQIPLASVCEETLLKGYQFVPGEFKQTSEIRTTENWTSQQIFLIEFDDTTEKSLDEFIQARPFVPENAWLVTESLRSRYDDPNDATCNGQLRVRIVFCLPRAVNTTDQRQWVYEALEKEMPDGDNGSANSITNGGLGNASAAFIKIGKIVDTDWFNTAIARGWQKKAEEDKAKRERAEKHKRKQAERTTMGFTEREGELPLEALAKSDPSLFLESLGLTLKSERGYYQHYGRPEKRGDTALSVWQSDHGNYQIRVFANSIPTPPSVSGAMPLTRFYCYHELNIDIKGLQPDTAQWKDINAELASRGYGTWLSDEAFNAHRNAAEPPTQRQRRSTLQITEGFSETLVSLAENQQAIRDAFTRALAKETDADIPHYHILHFEMGSGKNHAFLTTLATLRKRGIGVFENHEQVDEQVSKAVGDFRLRAMGFRGRGYLFDESGVSALPVNLRQQDSDLFEKYEVMCGFYDQILKRQSKGLGAYEYCLDCPFLKTCPYLAQFQIAAEMDFLAVCLHDIFFDPGFADFLGRLWWREEETEEETIIGDALGVATQKQMQYDIGVIDEVVAHNLYLSYEYTFADFQALAKAWEGEALGEFFTQVLRCLHTEDTDPLSAIQEYLKTIDDDTKGVISQQMTQIPKGVSVMAHTLRHKDTGEVLSEYEVVDNAENQWVIPVSPDAEKILRRKKVPTLAYQEGSRLQPPSAKIGVSPYGLLRRGEISVSEIQGRLWSKHWTLLDQLLKAVKLDIQWIGTKYNAKGEPVCCDTLTLTIPPQVNPIVKRLVLMGGTLDVENLKQAFLGQQVKITVEEGKTAAYAPGVQTYQFTDGRVTHQSVFEYETDAEGKTLYDEQTNAPVVIGIKPTALTFLAHLCRLAERQIAEGNLPPVFISYKDFTEPPIADLPIGRRMHNCLQVKHFDLTRGLNFEGVKAFITYGYPKSARPDVVKQTAETLHHADEKPLDFTYERVNETTDGYQAENIGQYKDPRVEAVRQQLTRDKSKQALYRARPTRWEGTLTLNVSAEPIPGWTERATGFICSDFYRAESFEEIGARIAERTALNAESSIADYQQAYGVSERHARRLWEQAGGKESKNDTDTELVKRILEIKAEYPKIGERKIAAEIGISYGKLRALLKKSQVH